MDKYKVTSLKLEGEAVIEKPILIDSPKADFEVPDLNKDLPTEFDDESEAEFEKFLGEYQSTSI